MKRTRIQKSLKTILFISLISVLTSFTSSKGVEGTWLYEAPEAPYEYSKGEIVIKKDKDLYNSEIKFKYNTLKINKVSVEKNTVEMKFYVEGQLIKVSLKIDGDSMVGSSITPEGILKLTGKRK